MSGNNDKSEQDVITLKWGNLKAWHIGSEAAAEVFNTMPNMTLPAGAASHHSLDQVEWLIRLIEASNCETIHLDWNHIDVSKQEAIDYVRKTNTAFREGT